MNCSFHSVSRNCSFFVMKMINLQLRAVIPQSYKICFFFMWFTHIHESQHTKSNQISASWRRCKILIWFSYVINLFCIPRKHFSWGRVLQMEITATLQNPSVSMYSDKCCRYGGCNSENQKVGKVLLIFSSAIRIQPMVTAPVNYSVWNVPVTDRKCRKHDSL